MSNIIARFFRIRSGDELNVEAEPERPGLAVPARDAWADDCEVRFLVGDVRVVPRSDSILR